MRYVYAIHWPRIANIGRYEDVRQKHAEIACHQISIFDEKLPVVLQPNKERFGICSLPSGGGSPRMVGGKMDWSG